MILDIVLKIIIQDINSKLKLSTRKYKPMMALDDGIVADWASYIFASLLDNVCRCRTLTKTKQLAEVHYGLLINYILEKMMPTVDRGEELADLDYLLTKYKG